MQNPINHFCRWKCTTNSSNLLWQRVADKSGRENQWDQREKVTLQSKTSYGEAILKKWLEEAWNDILHKPPSLGSSNKIIYADMNRSQQRLDVKNWLHKCKAKHLDANLELYIDTKLTAGEKHVFTKNCN